jgi:hypothetical protein
MALIQMGTDMKVALKQFRYVGLFLVLISTMAVSCNGGGTVPVLPLQTSQCPQGSGIQQANLPPGVLHSYATYRTGLQLDIWYRTDSAPRPTLFYVHGGGWEDADSRGWLITCDRGLYALNQVTRGYNVVSVQYTHAPDIAPVAGGDAGNIVRQVKDIHAAIRWMRIFASTFNVDQNRIGITGPSAGGHLSALAAVTANNPAYEHADVYAGNDSVNLVFAASPITDITWFFGGFGDPASLNLVGRKFGCLSSQYPLAFGYACNAATESAARVQDKVNWSSPWIAVAHAQNDGAVPPDQGHLLATLASSYGKLTNYFQSDVDGKALTGHNIEGNFVMSPSIDRMFDCRIAGTIAC